MQPSTAKPPQNAKEQTASATEEALNVSLARLQQVIDRLPQAIGWTDQTAVFLGCNQAFAQAAGFDHPAAIVGQAASAVQWYGQPATFLHDRQLLDQAGSECHQLNPLPQTEQPVWLAVSRMPLYDEHGSVEGILSMVEDVTERKQAEVALRQSEATNRALINAIPDLLFRIRGDGTYLEIQSSKDFKVLNPDQLVIGTGVNNSLPPACAQQRLYYVQQALRTGELQIYEQELLLDGVPKYEEVRIVPCQENEVMAMVRDITDRKQAEKALHLAQFSVEYTSDSIFWLRPDAQIIYANRAACQTLGYTADELRSLTVFDVDAEFPPEAWADHWQQLQQQGSFTLESTHRAKDGRLYPVEVIVSFFALEGEEYNFVRARDITDRKQAEDALKLTQFSVDRASDPVWWVGPDARIFYINDAGCRDLGYDREAIVGKQIFDFNPDEPVQGWADHWQDLKERGSFTFEARNRNSRGIIYPVEVTVNYIELNGREFNCVLVRNITERKQAEASLRLTQFSIDCASDAIWWVEPDGSIAYVNDAACREIGYTREEIMAKRVYDFAAGFTDGAWALHWAEVKERGSFSFETQNHHKNGTIYPVEVTVNYIELNGNALNCSFVRNITERKKAEAALRESEQQMREQAERERLLNRLLTRIRDSLDFDTILETTLQEVQNFVEADRCQFAWYDTNNTESYWEVIKEARHNSLPSLVDRYPVSPTSPFLLQLQDLQILRVEDAETLSESSLMTFVNKFGYRAMLAIPIQIRPGLLGTIFCCHSTEPRAWSDSEIELIQSVIGQLTIALTQAELYTQSRTKAQELEQALRELQQTQTQMVQSEKMSSLGQLVAGVAHEINNPVNFIYGNLNHASHYTQDLLRLIQLYQQHYPTPVPEIQAETDAIDLNFLLDDLPKLLSSMKVGADRIQKIVLSLRNFSRMDEADVKQVDIHEGIDSTLMILQSRLKGKAGQGGIAIIKAYGALPPVECYPGQLNQVFMNVLVNAIDALEESFEKSASRFAIDTLEGSASRHFANGAAESPNALVKSWSAADVQRQQNGQAQVSDYQPTIHIQTEQRSSGGILIKIADNGCGMTQAQQQRLFDPFFTTKAVGKGTGLGLSISYQIVVKKHGGTLTCSSTQGKGTEFCIEIPVGRG